MENTAHSYTEAATFKESLAKNFKPIFFSTEMVKAILDGRKTQTRRTISNEITISVLDYATEKGKPVDEFVQRNAKYKLDDILWVRESFCLQGLNDNFLYRVNHPDKDYSHRPIGGWKPSIHMPKEAARIFLKVRNVRCERLQDISNTDAMAEGILIERQAMQNGEGWFYPKNYLANNKHFGIGKYRDSFQSLWQSINAKKHPWESNPWVWVYDFEKIEKPENFI